MLLPGFAPTGRSETNPHMEAAEKTARAAYLTAQSAWTNDAKCPTLAWQFGRACFDLAEYVPTRRQRADLAEQGIPACQQSLRLGTNSAAAHYYLAMNLGQLARTRGFSALRLVSQLRREFEAALALDETFDNAGPHRNLGYLFRDTPTWTGIGNRQKAEYHLAKAVKLAPDHPENWIALIEGRLDWGAREKARQELKQLDALLPDARKRLTGPFWRVSWHDWDVRLQKIRKKLAD